jgi:hypothetical protein
MRSRPILILSTLICVAFASAAPAAVAEGVQPRFALSGPQGGPFPADLFTVPDAAELTGLRVNLPKPDCSVRPSDCNDINVLNELDGFNLQPRLSIPFTGPIDPTTVSSDTVFLVKLGCVVASCPGDRRVGINQVVWDPDTNTLYAESDQVLDQDARYLLVVTNGVRVPGGGRRWQRESAGRSPRTQPHRPDATNRAKRSIEWQSASATSRKYLGIRGAPGGAVGGPNRRRCDRTTGDGGATKGIIRRESARHVRASVGCEGRRSFRPLRRVRTQLLAVAWQAGTQARGGSRCSRSR